MLKALHFLVSFLTLSKSLINVTNSGFYESLTITKTSGPYVVWNKSSDTVTKIFNYIQTDITYKQDTKYKYKTNFPFSM